MTHASEYRSMADAALDEALNDARHALFNLRFQHARGQLADTSQLKAARREVARIQTLMRERRLWAEYQASVPEEQEEG